MLGETLVSLGRFAEGKAGQLRSPAYNLRQRVPGARIRGRSPPRHRRGFRYPRRILGPRVDAIGVRYSTALSDGVDAAARHFGTDQGKNGIDALGRRGMPRRRRCPSSCHWTDLIGAEHGGRNTAPVIAETRSRERARHSHLVNWTARLPTPPAAPWTMMLSPVGGRSRSRSPAEPSTPWSGLLQHARGRAIWVCGRLSRSAPRHTPRRSRPWG